MTIVVRQYQHHQMDLFDVLEKVLETVRLHPIEKFTAAEKDKLEMLFHEIGNKTGVKRT